MMLAKFISESQTSLSPVSYLQAVSYSHGVILHAMNVLNAKPIRHVCVFTKSLRVILRAGGTK